MDRQDRIIEELRREEQKRIRRERKKQRDYLYVQNKLKRDAMRKKRNKGPNGKPTVGQLIGRIIGDIFAWLLSVAMTAWVLYGLLFCVIGGYEFSWKIYACVYVFTAGTFIIGFTDAEFAYINLKDDD